MGFELLSQLPPIRIKITAMKTIMNYATLFVLLLTACSGHEGGKTNVDVEQTGFTFPNGGGSERLEIESNTDVTVRSTETWCRVELLTSSPTVRRYKITADPNPLPEIRYAGIVVTAKGFEKEIPVEQAAGNDESAKFGVRENFTTMQLVDEMGLGINLGNTLDATGDWINPGSILNYEQAWGSPVITERIIEGYAEAGYTSMRIPVSWSNLMSNDYTIHPGLMDRVESIVNWVLDHGMVAVVNMHHENEWIKRVPTDSEARRKFTSIWEQICRRFERYGDRLVFEPMNEIGFDEIWTPWSGGEAEKARAFGHVNELNQLFVDIVRGAGGNNPKRHLLVEIYNTGAEYAYDRHTRIPTDPANRLALTVHYYSPAVFAILGNGEDAGWGVGIESWGTDADMAELHNVMELLKKNCVDKGIPVVVGEYSANPQGRTQEVVRLYNVSVTEAVYSHGMCPMLWDTPGTGQYDRLTCTFKDPVFLEEIMAIPAKYPRH